MMACHLLIAALCTNWPPFNGFLINACVPLMAPPPRHPPAHSQDNVLEPQSRFRSEPTEPRPRNQR